MGTFTEFFSFFQGISAEQTKSFAADNLGFTLLLCFFSGFLTSFTPCVYPVIPITINIFGRNQPKRSHSKKFNLRSFGLASVYVGGMSFTYCLLGLISGLTGSLFGGILQSSLMLGFFTLLFAGLAISQLGIFKLALPGGLQTKLARIGNAENKWGIFIMGMVSGLIVSPCVGPVIAGILAFVFESSNAFLGMLYFLSFSLGLGILFLVIGGFSGALSALPRSGAWMQRVNYLLAALMFIASGYFGSLWAKNLGLLSNPSSGQKIQWFTDLTKALEESKKLQRPILVDFTAEWCGACHEMDRLLFQDSGIAKEIVELVIPLRLDVTAETEENSKLLQEFSVSSLPTLVFISASGQILSQPRVYGVIPSDKFLNTLHSIAKSQ